MRIGILDADLMDHGTRHPNLALMKIAGFYRAKGDLVELIYKDYSEVHLYDKVFVSKVFKFTSIPSEILSLNFVEYGGTGFYPDGGHDLKPEIEHTMPYYDLYKKFVEEELKNGKRRGRYADYLDYSIGFTTRGCFRKCDFCVNKKYDHVFRHSAVSEFFDKSRLKIYLWDDNILGYPQWESVLDELEKTGRSFQFRQGIDLRLMTEKKAYRFVNTNYIGDFIFAFDHITDRDIIIEKIQLWKRYSRKICKLYVLCGFESQDVSDIINTFERIKIIMQYGSLPYIMRHELYKESPYRNLYVQLARWCNQPQFYKKMSFREFCVANQKYKKNKATNCSAYQSMLDFEAEFPDITRDYFDLKFDELNIYKKQYGYGRRYENKSACTQCIKLKRNWDYLINGLGSQKLLQLYLTKEIDLLCLNYSNSVCKVAQSKIAKRIITSLLNTSMDDLISLIKISNHLEKVTKENIPQFSGAFEPQVLQVVNILKDEPSLTYDDLGELIRPNVPTIKDTLDARKKYGENHAKLATLLDLAVINRTKGKYIVTPNIITTQFLNCTPIDQKKLLKRLALRIPIVQQAVISTNPKKSVEENIQLLSKTTIKRRIKYSIDIINYVLD